MQEDQAYKFINWLSYQPSGSDICRALVTEYCLDLRPQSARIARLNPDDSLTYVGEYGFTPDESIFGRNIQSRDWRSHPTCLDLLTRNNPTGTWASAGNLLVLELRDSATIHGYLSVHFIEPVSVDRQDQIARDIYMYAFPVSLYFSLQNRLLNNGSQNGFAKGNQSFEVQNQNHNSPIKLTQRQIQILRGMVEGKTNHDLAMDLGFSVSTIRHETMAIYKELAVSDRQEAARVALSKGLIA